MLTYVAQTSVPSKQEKYICSNHLVNKKHLKIVYLIHNPYAQKEKRNFLKLLRTSIKKTFINVLRVKNEYIFY